MQNLGKIVPVMPNDYISFTDEGLIMVSSVLNYSDFRGLGINSELKLRWIEESHLEFLKYHREHIWKN